MKAKATVIKTLNKSKKLLKSVKEINTGWHDKKIGYPQITITQISSTVYNRHDNMVDGRIVTLQADIWSEGNPFVIAQMVHEVMSANGYEYLDERELNEENVNRIMLIYKILEF